MAKKVNIVYIVGRGSVWQNNELRFSLRSIARFGKNIGRVIIVGEMPPFVNPKTVTHVPFGDETDCKHYNIMMKINAAIDSLKLTEPFLISSDDHFLTTDTDFAKYPIISKGVLDAEDNSKGEYFRSLNQTRKWLKEHGVDCDVIIGAKNKDLVILEDRFKEVCNLHITTDDGSYGRSGMVTVALQDLWNEGHKYDHCVAIGPMIMMKFVCKLTKELGIPTVVSMNPIMVDGTGMCGCCRLTVGGETKFACVDGPDFDGFLVDFDEAMARGGIYKEFEKKAREETCNLLNKEVQ